jgi:hypothetical protein
MSYRVLPHIHNSAEYFSFKVETLKRIHSRLLKGDLRLSDPTVGSIMPLTDLEVSSLQLSTHIASIDI